MIKIRKVNACKNCASRECVAISTCEREFFYGIKVKVVTDEDYPNDLCAASFIKDDGSRYRGEVRGWCSYVDDYEARGGLRSFNNKVGFIVDKEIYFDVFDAARVWKKL